MAGEETIGSLTSTTPLDCHYFDIYDDILRKVYICINITITTVEQTQPLKQGEQ